MEIMEQDTFMSYPYLRQFMEKPSAEAKYLLSDEKNCVIIYQSSDGGFWEECLDKAWADNFMPGTVELCEYLDPCSSDRHQQIQNHAQHHLTPDIHNDPIQVTHNDATGFLLDTHRFVELAQRPDLLRFGLNNAISILLQAPHTTKILSRQELVALGIQPDSQQQAIPIRIPVTQTYFQRNNQRVSIHLATVQEQEAIIKGTLPTTNDTVYRLGQVYDISQLDKYLEPILLVTQPTLSFVQFQQFVKSVQLPDNRSLSVEEMSMPPVELGGYYSSESATIFLRREASPKSRLRAIIYGIAHAITEATAVPHMELAASLISAQIYAFAGISMEDAHVQQLTNAYKSLNNGFKSLQKMENIMARTARIVEYIYQGVSCQRGQEIVQEQQQERQQRQTQEDILTNFLQGL